MGSCWLRPRVVPSTYQTGELRKSVDMSASEARPRFLAILRDQQNSRETRLVLQLKRDEIPSIEDTTWKGDDATQAEDTSIVKTHVRFGWKERRHYREVKPHWWTLILGRQMIHLSYVTSRL